PGPAVPAAGGSGTGDALVQGDAAGLRGGGRVVVQDADMSTRRTDWHLEALQRAPSEYGIAATGLLYHPARGFEVETPASEWYRKYQKGSPLSIADPDRFRDPRETT